MSRLNPLGLLALLAIPVLILIYIIKSKYTEQTIPSTYLWELSEKFLKRRNPISKVAGIISLILQILVVLFIAIAISNPVFAIRGAAYDYCFILDGSGSMSIEQNGSTRFELAKREIDGVISDSAEGCSYTLVFVGDVTNIVYKGIEDKVQAKELLNALKPSYSSNGVESALAQAQEYFNENNALKVYLVTDKDYEKTSNVQVINVSSGAENYALSDVNFTLSDNVLTVGGKAVSYESAATLNIELYLDGSREVTKSITVDIADKLQFTDFSFDEIEADSLQSVRVVITNKDALALDNEIILFSEEYENSFTVLLVKGNEMGSFLLLSLLSSNPNAQVTSVDGTDYATINQSYDLYVFDTFTPEELPSDGAVWFVNPQKTLDKTGFSVQSVEDLSGGELVFSNSSQTYVKTILQGIIASENAAGAKYGQCGTSRRFPT
ncbi:MAG: BatA and WFA domain-containing protein, partial [Clostridia bacterium]|nr:BatA and WFA domain-containing protein [Clostridia bacterium]